MAAVTAGAVVTRSWVAVAQAGASWPRAAATASTRLAALRTWLDTHGDQMIIVVCVVVGLWLTGESSYPPITT